jgi:hypothetical protein
MHDIPVNPSKTSYYRARYYDPSTGRFVSEDPIREMGGIDFYIYTNNRPATLVDPSGLMVDYAGFAISNPLVRRNFERLDALIVQSGIPDSCFTLRVTGGDRYRDPINPKKIRSSTNNAIVPNAAPNSPHLIEKGARAIDFRIENHQRDCFKCKAVTDDLIDQLLPLTSFSTLPGDVLRDYPNEPHTHINIPNLPVYYVGH